MRHSTQPYGIFTLRKAWMLVKNHNADNGPLLVPKLPSFLQLSILRTKPRYTKVMRNDVGINHLQKARLSLLIYECTASRVFYMGGEHAFLVRLVYGLCLYLGHLLLPFACFDKVNLAKQLVHAFKGDAFGLG